MTALSMILLSNHVNVVTVCWFFFSNPLTISVIYFSISASQKHCLPQISIFTGNFISSAGDWYFLCKTLTNTNKKSCCIYLFLIFMFLIFPLSAKAFIYFLLYFFLTIGQCFSWRCVPVNKTYHMHYQCPPHELSSSPGLSDLVSENQ